MDRRRRELERRALTGDEVAQAGLLAIRVRLGELSEDDLRLAAYLGHRPAQIASASDDANSTTLSAWIGGLSCWGRIPVVRAGVAVIRPLPWEWQRAYDELEELPLPPHSYYSESWSRLTPWHLLDSVAEWIQCPCEMHGMEATRLSARLSMTPPIMWPWRPLADAVRLVAQSVAGVPHSEAWTRVARAAEIVADRESEAQVRRRVASELVPWILNTVGSRH